MASQKTIYYSVTFIICIIASIMAMLNLRSFNKYPSKTAVKNSLSLYIKNYYNLAPSEKIKENFQNKIFPFDIEFKKQGNPDSKQFAFNYDSNLNKLILTNYDSLSEESKNFLNDTLGLISLPINITKNYNVTSINTTDKLNIYNHLNVYIVVSEDEDLKTYELYLKKFEEFKSNFLKNNEKINIVIKFVYFNSKEELINLPNQIIYNELKQLNPPSFFYENLDKEKLGIFLVNTNKTNLVKPKYNEDLRSIIYPVNFDKDLSPTFLNKIIAINHLGNYFNLNNLSLDLFTPKVVNEFIKFFNDKYIQFHLKSLITLKNMDKISRIFPLYETIKTYTHAKVKLDEIHNILKLFVTHKKFGYDNDLLNKLYMDTIFLLESSELVTFELYFSFEFKIGQFLPIMMPIIYGMMKITKSHFK